MKVLLTVMVVGYVSLELDSPTLQERRELDDRDSWFRTHWREG